MAATTRKWILYALGINLLVSIIFAANGIGLVSENMNSDDGSVNYDLDLFGLKSTANEMHDDQNWIGRASDTFLNYVNIGISITWFGLKIVAMLILGTPIATLYLASDPSLTGSFKTIAWGIGLVMMVVNIWFIYAVWVMIAKPKSD